jgi:hypothetical protein
MSDKPPTRRRSRKTTKHRLGKVIYNEPIIEKAEIFLRSKELSRPGGAVEVVARLIYIDYTDWLWQRQLGIPRRQRTVTVDLDRGWLINERRGCPRFANLAWFLGAVRAFLTTQFPGRSGKEVKLLLPRIGDKHS